MDIDLEACIRGDQNAWNAFVDRYTGVIFAAVQKTIQGRTGGASRGEIEDAIQDVFLRLVKHDYRLLRTWDSSRSSFTTWLTLIARSASIDALRRRRPDSFPLEPDIAPAPEPGDHPVVPSVPLHLLTARQRLVLGMLFDEGRTVDETARLLGVNAQTIRSTKHKALSRLRDQPERVQRSPGKAGDEPGPDDVPRTRSLP